MPVSVNNKIKIHVIEPHPDDALGSACGICYNDNATTALHTISKSYDKRDDVVLDREGRQKYRSLKKDLNIYRHERYMLPDLHYDLRIQDKNVGFAEKVFAYKRMYPAWGQLNEKIKEIFTEAMEEKAYISFPMGLGHPMHILTLVACLEWTRALDFDKSKIIIYVDHPYDFQAIGTDRAIEVKNYIEDDLSGRLLRCDSMDVIQAQVGPLLNEIYGQMHYGEFDGSIERTVCSCYVTENGYEQIQGFFKLQCNHILYISAQAWPFFKTGGLGEVAYGYCKALQSSVDDVRILIPGYISHDETEEKGKYMEGYSFAYKNNEGTYQCKINKREYDGLIYYLLKMWDPNGKQVDFQQESRSGKDFALFCDAILQKGLNVIDYRPNICHCNDWQTALIPFLKKTKYKNSYRGIKTVYTIHFYGYKGIFPKKEMLSQMGMDKQNCELCITCQEDCILDRTDLLNKAAKGELLQMPPSLMSCMRAGIEFADAVTTVSKGYAEEISSYPDLRGIKVTGIRNGLSAVDDRPGITALPEKSNPDGLREYKKERKKDLQKELDLNIDENIPLVCMVTRLAIEKGIELVKNIIPLLMKEGAQMVIVGDDSDKLRQPYANYFREIEAENKGCFCYRPFSDWLEYKTYAGADILLMPSLSEACGTTQMKAMQYGAIPVVSMLPSFRDTVLDYKLRDKRNDGYLDRGVGFYAYKDDCWVFLEVLRKVFEVYRTEPEEWCRISKTCSETDFSWKNGSIYGYLKLYNSLWDIEP